MPDLLDRTRIAAIAVLAAFAALALTFVTHLATTGVSLQVPGLPGEGLVLLAPDGASPSGGTQAGSGAVSGSATSPLAPGGFASGGEAGSRAGQNAGPEAGAPNTGSGPRQVGISIGSASPGQPGATPAPGATPTPVTGSPGTGTSGTGGSPRTPPETARRSSLGQPTTGAMVRLRRQAAGAARRPGPPPRLRRAAAERRGRHRHECRQHKALEQREAGQRCPVEAGPRSQAELPRQDGSGRAGRQELQRQGNEHGRRRLDIVELARRQGQERPARPAALSAVRP